MNESEDNVKIITKCVREADIIFHDVGGTTRHWVMDCFLPAIEKAGLCITKENILRERDELRAKLGRVKRLAVAALYEYDTIDKIIKECE